MDWVTTGCVWLLVAGNVSIVGDSVAVGLTPGLVGLFSLIVCIPRVMG